MESYSITDKINSEKRLEQIKGVYEYYIPLYSVKEDWFYEQFYENVTARNTIIMRTSTQASIDYNEIMLSIAQYIIDPSVIIGSPIIKRK